MLWASDVMRKGDRGCRSREGLYPPGRGNLLPSQQYQLWMAI